MDQPEFLNSSGYIRLKEKIKVIMYYLYNQLILMIKYNNLKINIALINQFSYGFSTHLFCYFIKYCFTFALIIANTLAQAQLPNCLCSCLHMILQPRPTLLSTICNQLKYRYTKM